MEKLRLLGIAVFCATLGGSAAETPFVIRSQQNGNWVVEYQRRDVPYTMIEVDGQPHLLFSDGVLSEYSEGIPQLPSERFSLGIPFGSTLVVELLNPEYDVVENQLVAPTPGHSFTEEQEAVAEYRKDVVAYSQNRFFPDREVSVHGPFTLRQQQIATIRLHPYQYNPAARVLKRLVRGTLNVRLMQSKSSQQQFDAVSTPDPFYEQTYKSLIMNYDQAKSWRRKLETGSVQVQDSTRDWFETGKNYYKIRIASDGWYKVTRADLISAGANPSLIDLPTLKVFGRGVQVPIVVRPDTTVEFYAYRNYGDSSFIDFYTDTSAYWLTWGGAPGMRFAPAPSHTGTTGSDIVSAKVVRHMEFNSRYFTGTTTADIINIETVAGEGWIWQFFFPNTNATYPFTLDTIDATQGPTSTLRVRLFSTTLHYNNPNHVARFWMNDSLVGEVGFAGRTGVTYTATIPTSWLRNGTNNLRILSVPTLSSPNQFYLDWFEVDHQRFLKAQSNQLIFSSPTSSGANPARFTVAGFTTPQIDVFDLQSKRMIGGGTVTGNDTIGYTIAFKDTFSTARTYVVVGSAGPLAVLPLRQKMFSDIRVNPSGADYIIITHSNFLTSAQQLASHRQSANGVRTKVILVEDIYDEFNYGVFNATKIKTFLRYAYLNWPSPAPSYLVMFGDASWDYNRYLSSTIKTNYVPTYGIPAGDNWFTCFSPDTTFLPYMYTGRIPVQDTIQAQRTVAKLVGYDNYPLSDWNKNFLYITGGNSLSEQIGFNYLSETSINTYVLPPSIGGTPFRVYKATLNVIDGEHKQRMRQLVKDGLVFITFLGHSGGRIWGVDIGSTYDLENTNGKLPFVASVSCNVGAFAEPSNNVLSEDFLLADNRGGIASWASSSLGYANYGQILVNHFLAGVKVDSIRDFGKLTTIARYKLWLDTGSGFITIAMVNLNPLVGDPLSRMAIPLKPDLAITAGDISLTNPTPTPNDSVLTARINLHNWGLVPSDSVAITLTDIYGGQTSYILNNKRIAPTRHHDSLFVSWDGSSKVGLHTVVASLDPSNLINEVNELNNVASSDQYVYANLLAVVKPLDNMVVQPGIQRLVVTSPVGLDSVGFQYFFELDTVETFNSPSLVSSPPVTPGPVTGEWLTPFLPGGRLYFWRARTVDGTLLGNWVVSTFSTSVDVPTAPNVRWRQSSRKHFARDVQFQTLPTDSGVTIAPNPTLFIMARSLGYRANANRDAYSQLRINDQIITGYWWELGNGFMVARINEFSGEYEFRAFNVPGQSAQADSMRNFINNTPVGNYLSITVIFDGRTNVNESLYQAIESLGSTMIRQVTPGQSWALIGRKGSGGPGMPPLEGRNDDTVVVSMQVPNFYSFGSGAITTKGFTIPTSWGTFHWRHGGVPGVTQSRIALLGVRTTGEIDTLQILPQDSIDVDLSFLNPLTSGPRYSTFRHAGLLSSSDALVTPVLRDWWLHFTPPADLAISSRTIGGGSVPSGTPLNLPVTIHNIGFQKSDSSRVFVSIFDKYNKARLIASATVDSIPVGGSRSIVIPIQTVNFSRRVTLQVVVAPAKKGKDLVAENNTAYTTFYLSGGSRPANIQIFADGTQIMDGDYISARPTILVRAGNDGEEVLAEQVDFFVNNKLVERTHAATMAKVKTGTAASKGEATFTPELPNGHHELKFRFAQMNAFGHVDSIEQTVMVQVLSEARVLQVYNYPNPFSRETHFTFMLTGSNPPEELTIRIFTVSGRKIREIHVPGGALHVGFNRVYWDGRDNDGDEIANGYYFYRITIKGDGKTDAAVEKLAKIR